MKTIWMVAVFLTFLEVQRTYGRTISKRNTLQDSGFNPVYEIDDDDDQHRDKRKVEESFGVKNALLGFVFNSGKTSSHNVVRVAAPPKVPTTTEEIVIFEKNKPVSLQVPDQLFGSSFNLVTDVSTSIGDFMINSALRAQRVLETMRPLFWKIFGKNGVVIEANTDKPLFSDEKDN